MRVSRLNIGYDYNNKLIALYELWNRDHTIMQGGTISGAKEIGDFIGSLLQDGYKGKQMVRVVSRSEQFSPIAKTASLADLEKILVDIHVPDNLTLVTKQV